MAVREPQARSRSLERWAVRYGSLVAVTDAGAGPLSSGAMSRSTSSPAPLWLYEMTTIGRPATESG